MPTRRRLLLSAAALALVPAAMSRAGPVAVTLYKSPDCGCCDGYVDYLRQHNFAVTVRATPKLAEISRQHGVPGELQGCHTSLIAGYVVDGHVPVEAIEKLLRERPDIKGITLAGMPIGSPGMSGAKTEPFTIHAIGKDGRTAVFMML